MDPTITEFTPASPSVESTPDASKAITAEIIKEFVRRPAKGWTDSTPALGVRSDDPCAVWERP